MLAPSGKPTAIGPADVKAATHIFAIGCTLPEAARQAGKGVSWSDVPTIEAMDRCAIPSSST